MKTRTRDRQTFSTVPTSIRLDTEVDARLRRQARRLGVTRTAALRLALGLGLEGLEVCESMPIVHTRDHAGPGGRNRGDHPWQP